MVARTTPIGVKLKPDQPQTDAERRRKLLEQLRRNTLAVAKIVQELQEIDDREQQAA